jgi:hypothetical protein
LILLLQYLSPLWACLVYWLLALLSERLEFWLHGKITVTDMCMFIANLSIGLMVAYVAPDVWWIRLPALFITPVAAFALSEWLRAVMGIPRKKEARYMPADEDTAKEKCKHPVLRGLAFISSRISAGGGWGRAATRREPPWRLSPETVSGPCACEGCQAPVSLVHGRRHFR